jgi:hypothetical protein
VHDKQRSATFRQAKPSSPCVARESHGKGFAERTTFSVRCCGGFAVQQTLSCACQFYRAAGFAVRFSSTPHGKEPYSSTTAQRNA